MDLTELQVIPEYRDALRGLSEREEDTLRKNIIKDGFLDPVKWHYNESGIPCIVDGMHRFKIWKTLPEGCSHTPLLMEVPTLHGLSSDEIVDWIQRTQIGRRNDDLLVKRYEIGRRFNEGEDPVAIAEEAKLSVASVSTYGKLASRIDAADFEEPGLKGKILTSGKSISSVSRAIEENSVNSLLRDEPPAPKDVNHFKSAKTALASLTRAVMRLQKNTGDSGLSDDCIGICTMVREKLNTWELLELGVSNGGKKESGENEVRRHPD